MGKIRNETERPKVGIGLMILKGDQVLMGKRKNTHGHGTWSFTGGYLEFGESFEKCLKRELKEECGVKIKDVRFQCVANVIKYGKHHVLVGFVADWKSGDPILKEPEKLECWDWFPINKLPKPIFEASRLIVKSYIRDNVYVDN